MYANHKILLRSVQKVDATFLVESSCRAGISVHVRATPRSQTMLMTMLFVKKRSKKRVHSATL